MSGRFDLVFQKLAEVTSEQSSSPQVEGTLKLLTTEVDEIAELGRIVMETTVPNVRYYTST